MKKVVALLLIAVMTASLLAGCGSSAPAANEPAKQETKKEEPKQEAKKEEPKQEVKQEAAPAPAAEEWKPDKPITILNYVAAGGGMDLATRKFVELAAKYTDATFVVDNMTGATGLIAAEHVLGQPADGYLVYATTVSYVYAIAAAEEDHENYIDGFEWIDNIMADPYCILVANTSDYTLESLVADAKANEQIWCVPNAGGAKHIAAIQMCQNLGIDVKVVPYESGPLAVGAVVGGQGAASVGNPGDTGKYDVRAVVVGAQNPLDGLGCPTFAGAGYDKSLDDLSMWRGYAVKKGTPEGMIKWFQNLCDQITADPEWIEYFAAQNVVVKNDTTDTFTAQVKADFESGKNILKGVGMISEDYN